MVSGEKKNLQNPEELRQFVQEKSPEELQKIEDEKARLEAQYEERQLEVSEKAERLQEKIKQKELELGQVFAEVEELKTQLAEKQLKTLAKIFNLSEIRALREKIGVNTVKVEELQKEFSGLWILYNDLQKEARSRVEIDEAERLVSEFYVDQAQKLEEHEKDKQARDVTNASRRNNAVITHSFMEYAESSNTTQFTVVQKGVTWKEKLKILLALEPQVSTASVRLDNFSNENVDGVREPDRPYFSLGVLLKGGEAVLSSSGDMFTVPVDGKREAGSSHENSFGGSANDLDKAINNRLPLQQNEIAISQPKVSALFVDSDFSNLSDDYDIKKNPNLKRELLDTARSYGLPLFQRDVKTGQFFEVSDIKKDKVVDGGFQEREIDVVECDEQPTNIEEILNSNFELSQAEKDKLVGEIFAGDYFKLDMEERKQFDSFVSAREVVDLFEKIKSGQIDSFGDKNKVEQLGRGYLSIKKPSISLDCKRDISSVDIYIAAIRDSIIPFFEKAIVDWEKIKEKEEDENKKQHSERHLIEYKKKLQELHWHLWGISDASKQIGNLEVAEMAKQLASLGVSEHDKQQLLDKRMSGDGKFKMTKEDLVTVRASQYS